MLDFWAIAAAIAALTALLLIRPLVSARRAGASRASHDVAVFRDQLAAVDRDLDRGVLSEAEADGARAEVSRRLLAAAAEAERSDGAGPAPAGASRIAAVGMAALVAAAGAGLYLHLGAPGAPDAPLKPRLEDMRRAAAERPVQLEAERLVAESAAPRPAPGPDEAQMRAMIDRLRQVLAERPDDLRGRRLLVQALMRLDDTAAAWRAQEEVLTLLGDQAAADDHALAAEAMILAVRGYVSPQAEAHLTKALAIDPAHTTARYYAGLSLAQNGRPDLTLDLWTPLLSEGPPDAPWKEPILTMIGGVAAEAGKEVPDVASTAADALRAARAAPGPDADALRAAEDMTPEARREMIEGMVARLENKLATTGGAPADWARLIQAYGVLGRPDDIARVLGSARDAFAAAPGVVSQLEAVAAQAEAAQAPALPGPDADAVRDAQAMAPDDRAAMIAGMVARLADRLAAEGGTPAEWARLINAYGVTGDRDAGLAARDAALAAHGADADARAQIEAAAATLPEAPR